MAIPKCFKLVWNFAKCIDMTEEKNRADVALSIYFICESSTKESQDPKMIKSNCCAKGVNLNKLTSCIVFSVLIYKN